MFGIGMQELAVIFVVALLIFGPKRLPELARTLGKGMAEFRKASNELRRSFSLEMDNPPPKAGHEAVHNREPIAKPDQLVDDTTPNPSVDASGHGDLAEDGPMIAPPPAPMTPRESAPSVESARSEDEPVTEAAAVPSDRPRD
jgi:TatA/E family protein of Tat protein translocase